MKEILKLDLIQMEIIFHEGNTKADQKKKKKETDNMGGRLPASIR